MNPHLPLDQVVTMLAAELKQDVPNIHQIREMCRIYPSLLNISGFRTLVWTLFLLGRAIDTAAATESVEQAKTECLEQQVLLADVIRTRGDLPQVILQPLNLKIFWSLSLFFIISQIVDHLLFPLSFALIYGRIV